MFNIITAEIVSILEVFAQDSVFVGDNPEADILGAKSAKMYTIWKRNSQWLEPESADAIINELSEIPLLLTSLA